MDLPTTLPLPRAMVVLLLGGLVPMAHAAQPASPPAASALPAVKLAPFKVIGEWMDIQPVLTGGRIDYIRILNLRPSSPAALAGAENGMRIVRFQEIEVRGLKESEFTDAMDRMTLGHTLTLVIDGGLARRTIAIPLTRNLTLTPRAPSQPDLPRTELPAPSPVAEPTATPASAPAESKPPLSEAEMKQRLTEMKKAFEVEMLSMRASLRAATSQAQGQGGTFRVSAPFDPELTRQGRNLAAEFARQNVGLVCATAVETDKQGGPFSSTLVAGINQNQTYTDAQKAVILDYVPRLPSLIVLVNRLQWVEDAGPRIAEGWKKFRSEERDDGLPSNISLYARTAAKVGVTDALVALARTVKNPAAAEKRFTGKRLVEQELATLASLVPAAPPAAVADYVLKNRSKLVFDQATKTYRLPSKA